MKKFSSGLSDSGGRGFLLSCLYSQFFFIGISIVLLLITCAVAVSLDDPDSVATPLSLAVLYLSAFGAGIAAVRLSGDGIVSGAVSGLFSAIIVLLLSFLPLPPSNFDATTSVLCTLLVIPAAVLGSVIGHKREKKPTYAKMTKMKRR